MDQPRKGLEGRPLNDGKMDYSKIPKLRDFLPVSFVTRCQFCNNTTQNEGFLGCQTCFNFEDAQMTLVINVPDGSTSLSSPNGTVSMKFF